MEQGNNTGRMPTTYWLPPTFIMTGRVTKNRPEGPHCAPHCVFLVGGQPRGLCSSRSLFHGGLLYSTWHRVLANGGLSHVASSWSPFFPGKPVLHTLWGCALLHPATHEPERSSHVPLCALTWILLEVMGKPNRKGSQCSDSKSQTQPLQKCSTFAEMSQALPDFCRQFLDCSTKLLPELAFRSFQTAVRHSSHPSYSGVLDFKVVSLVHQYPPVDLNLFPLFVEILKPPLPGSLPWLTRTVKSLASFHANHSPQRTSPLFPQNVSAATYLLSHVCFE